MLEIVASFIRKDTRRPFFYDLYREHPVLLKIHKNANKIPGYLGINEDLFRSKFRCDKALRFENEESFTSFVKENKLLLYKRYHLIENYCFATGHLYKYYINNLKESI